MDHYTLGQCAPKVKKEDSDFPLVVRAGKWCGEIDGEGRDYFDISRDPQGTLSLLSYRLEIDSLLGDDPPEDNPPSIHKPSGRWYKRIRDKATGERKFYYFGYVADDPDGVEATKWYQHDRPYLDAGLEPPKYRSEPVVPEGGLTIRDLVDDFLMEKDQKLIEGNLSERSYADYRKTCGKLRDLLGAYKLVEELTHRDFRTVRIELSKKLGNVSLGNELTRMRSVFKFAVDVGLIDKPVNYGKSFDKPSKKSIRRDRNNKKMSHGLRMLEADELRMLLDALDGNEVMLKEPNAETGKPVKVTLKADPVLKAMILLGINGGLGNTDCSEMVFGNLDLERGWIDYPRVKTQVEREIPLWDETVDALKRANEVRPTPKPGNESLVFVTVRGNKWVTVNATGSPNDQLGKSFTRVLKNLGLKRPGLSFYALRHTFETIAGETKDQVGTNAIMGHSDDSMADAYRERIEDERLITVTNHVRSWLWPESTPG